MEGCVRAATPRIRGHRWMAIRRFILSRDPICKECLKKDIVTSAVEVDHIVPLSRGGSNEEENLQGLCKPCHSMKTTGHSPRPVIGIDGWPVNA